MPDAGGRAGSAFVSRLSRGRPPSPVLCLVAGGEGAEPGRLVEIVEQAVLGGVDVVQLRDRASTDGDLLPTARALRRSTRGRAMLFINGRPDLAAEVGADGVHWPEFSHLRQEVERESAGGLIGRSVHGVESALRAVEAGADYLIVGHVFDTISHPGEAGRGTALIAEVRRAVDTPIVAIGGIDGSTARSCIEAGADGVAVISAIMRAADPEAAARGIKRAMLGNVEEKGGVG